MFIISLHKTTVHAPIGLYPQEKIKGNKFEIDVDVWVEKYTETNFVDYAWIQEEIKEIFQGPGDLMEPYAENIYKTIKARYPDVVKIRVAIRKLNPPLELPAAYSQIVLEL